ncbi:MAG: hypothetical protein NPIRA05_03410 [Nitrospirales bacterium]|nr:MAG: hypothetical protein NPIRA05_03410 [Nitrospirales bacterium]
MTKIALRQSGGSIIVSIPKAITETLGLIVGSSLDLTLEGNKIVLTPLADTDSLESLLEGCSQENFAKSDEDSEWVDAKPVGNEL